jgi:hypothetical protein
MLPRPWGSDTVRNEGTLRGGSAPPAGEAEAESSVTSALALGGSRGVLASDDSSKDGEIGLLSMYSSGVSTGVSSSYPGDSRGSSLAMVCSCKVWDVLCSFVDM